MSTLLKRVAMLTGGSLLGLGIYIGCLHISGNFHEVVAGKLYRSAQPSARRLADYISRYGIKTVINLHGPSERDWYRQEVAVTGKMSVQHMDFPMSAGN